MSSIDRPPSDEPPPTAPPPAERLPPPLTAQNIWDALTDIEVQLANVRELVAVVRENADDERVEIAARNALRASESLTASLAVLVAQIAADREREGSPETLPVEEEPT